MNLLVNRNCNLACPYCFAAKIFKEDSGITFEEYKKHIDFLNRLNEEEVRLIGGEPLLHPNIKRFVNYATVKGIKRVLIFTNGLLLDKMYNIANIEKVDYLVNINSPENIGQENYNKIINNLKNYPVKNRCMIGINIYKENQDIKFFLNAIKETKPPKIRVGIASLNYKKASKIDMFEYYKSLKPVLLELIEYCLKTKTEISIDCNGIPPCCFNDEEKEMLKQKNVWDLIDNRCSAVFDILPNGDFIRCFPVSEVITLKDYTQYQTFKDMKNALYEPFKKINDKRYNRKECENCEYKRLGKCKGGCLSFYMDEYC